jgi:hypothetical protein
MIRRNVLLVLALTALLAMPPLPAAPAPSEGPAAPRSEYRQPSPQEYELTLNASNSKYESAAFKIPVPSNASTTSASCDITGRYVKGALTYKACDFQDDTAGHKGYKGIVSDFTRNVRVWSLAQNQMGSTDYSDLAASDDSYVEQNGDFQGFNDGYELFNFKVGVSESKAITVYWEGHAEWYGSAREYTIYIWNNYTSIWELVDTGSPPNTNDVQVSVRFDQDWYIDNRSVWVMAYQKGGYFIMTDYVNITISGYPYVYPKNPVMDIGADGKPEWTFATDKLDYTVTAAESTMLTALDAFSRNTPAQFPNVTIRFVSDTPCKIRLTQFAYNYSAPPWCRPIPELFIDEDSGTTSVLDLNSFFTDDADRRFGYQVTYQQDPKKVQALIDADNHTLDMKTVTRNWWGSLRFRVSATDSEGLAGESANFTLTVRPVNDPPVIQAIPDQTATEDIPFSYKITARDVDTDLDPAETITYNSSSSFFTIDPETGWINFTPAQKDVGTWYICVTATDSSGVVGSQLMTMFIQDVEDPPVMKPIPDLRAEEGVLFTYKVNVTDPDLPYGDSINFTDDCPLFNITKDTGIIEFMPTIDIVGFYRGNITVKDARGGKDTRMFNLSVVNSIGSFDHPPTVEAVPNFTIVAGTPFFYQVNASDPDEDDVLGFKDNCPAFNIGASNGTISFTPRDSDAGTYTVKITVSDWEGLEAVTSFKLTILKYNSPPNITNVKPKNGSKYLFDHEVVFTADATDPEGDRLTYTWTEGNRTLGRGSMIVTMFSLPGTYVVTLNVSDGRDSTTRDITIVIVTKLPDQKRSPGFEGLFVLAVVAVALALAWRRKR